MPSYTPVIVEYQEVADYVEAHPKDFPALPNGGRYTGHHMIPDHCMYACAGVGYSNTSKQLMVPACALYNFQTAPVIIVSADANGGKSRDHGKIHQYFDPKEHTSGPGWSLADAIIVAAESVDHAGLGVSKLIVTDALEKYYKTACMMKDETIIRAGERSVHPEFQPRVSKRQKTS